MNPNIKVINKYLWAVNFDYVKAGWIKEITLNQIDSSAPACFLDSGIVLVNSNYVEHKDILLWMENTMRLPAHTLGTVKGFYELLRKLIPKAKKYTDKQIESIIGKKEYDPCRSVYFNCCEIEKQRRILQKQKIRR